MPNTSRAQSDLYFWEYSVDAMGFFDMPDEFEASIELNKYDRFTGYVKELILRTVKGNSGFNQFDELDIDRRAFPKNWWDTAMKVADGKKVDRPIPAIKNVTDDAKTTVYETIIPAYRVLKESFETRRWYDWIFNHSQYVAERDTIKALSGLMTSLLGVTQEEIDTALGIHIETVPTSGVSAEERKEQIKSVKDQKIDDIKNFRDVMLFDEDDVIQNLWGGVRTYNKPIFTEKEREAMSGDYGFEDGYFGEEIENVENFETELDMGKEQVVFENNEFAEFDNQIGNAEPIGKNDEFFIEKDDNLIDDINAIGL